MDFKVYLIDGNIHFLSLEGIAKEKQISNSLIKNIEILQFDETNDYHRLAVHFAKPGS